MNRHVRQLAQGTVLLIELMAGSALSLGFHFLLRNDTVTWTVLGVGVLVSLATSLVRYDVNCAKNDLCTEFKQDTEKLASETLEIAGILSEIVDKECYAKAQEVIEATKKTLTSLKQGYVPLDEAEFFLRMTGFVDESVRTVSVVEPLGVVGNSRGVRRSLQIALNRASARGVAVTRIFIVGDETVTPEIIGGAHATETAGALMKVVLFRELPSGGEFCGQDAARLNFAIFDDQIVAEAFATPGRYFGRKTNLLAEVSKYQRVFSMLDHAAHPIESLLEEDGKLLPSG